MNVFLNMIPLSTLFYVAALTLYLFNVKKITVFSFTFVGVLFLEIIHLGIEHFISGITVDENSYYFVLAAWYLSFAVTDFLFVGLIIFLSKFFNIKLDRASFYLVSLYIFMGIVQLIRYFERLYVDSEIVGVAYSTSIIFANLVVGVILIGTTLKVVVDNIARRNAAW